MTSILERDTEFCSGTEEDELEAEDDIHSPTDASEDSVDVKVEVISFKNKNKRKCSEPKKVKMNFTTKKPRLDLSITQKLKASSSSPFRPWSVCNRKNDSSAYESLFKNTLKIDVGSRINAESPKNSNTSDYVSKNSLFPSRIFNSFDNTCNTNASVNQNVPQVTLSCQETMALVPKGEEVAERKLKAISKYFLQNLNYGNEVDGVPLRLTSWNLSLKNLPEIIPSKIKFFEKINENGSYLRNKINCARTRKVNIGEKFKAEVNKKADILSQIGNRYKVDKCFFSGRNEKDSGALSIKSSHGSQQKNYKNMTRERRIEANARERTRVHTISAAFDTLRRSIPAYSHNQKLSKLSVLRIACSYIITLSRLAGYDYSKDQSQPDLSNCVEKVSKTIQTEGKIRKKREDQT